MQLLVDIGTNAEIVLGDRSRVFAASSPTGPAFEGAQISCGQRATAGAIERVRIDPVTFEPRCKVIGTDAWTDDAGFDADRSRASAGPGSSTPSPRCSSPECSTPTARSAASSRRVTPRVVPDGRTFAYVLSASDGSTRLAITQNDVRAIQLAKAALRAGIDLLLEHAGGPVVTDIRLAGAFGAHIDPAHALVLGSSRTARSTACGPSATRPVRAPFRRCCRRAARHEMESAAREVVKIETATEPRFQELFVAAMAIPHGSMAPTTSGSAPRSRGGTMIRVHRRDR